MTVDELKLLITADTEKFDKGILSSKEKLNTFKASIGNLTASVFKGAFLANILTKSIGNIGNVASKSIQRVDVMNNFPQIMNNLGISSEEASISVQYVSEKLKGLPTTIDEATSAITRFTSSNNNIKASTNMFLALNNAILAGGASTDIQRSALEQLSQAYTKGKPDIMEWRTAMMAMPAQMKQISQSMGFIDTDQLGEALRSGTISMNDFMAEIVRLNRHGINGLASFEEQARTASGGINTSMQNLRTAFVRGFADIINTIGQSNIAVFFNGIARAVNGVIPYLVAFVKVAQMAIASIGGVFGIFGKSKNKTNILKNLGGTSKNVSHNLSGLGGAGERASKGMDKARGSASKLKKELLGLASFDEMNVLKSKEDAGTSGGSSSGIGNGGVGGVGNFDLPNIDNLFDEKGFDNKANKVDEIVKKLLKFFEPLNKIDFTPLKHSFDFLAEAVKPLNKIILNGLKGAYEKVLVPLSKWSIEKALPALIRTLGSSFKFITEVLKVGKNVFVWTLDNFLFPLSKVAGGVTISAIKGIGYAFEFMANSIKVNIVFITNAGKAFISLIGIIKLYKATSKLDIVFNTAKTAIMSFITSVKVASAGVIVLGDSTKAVSVTCGALQLIFGVLQGKIALTTLATAAATAAQNAFNAAVATNPIGLILTAVIAGSAAYYAFAKKMQEGTQAQKEATEETKRQAEEYQNLIDATNEIIKVSEDRINSDMVEIKNSERLKSELASLVGEKGRVKEKDQDRVKFILGELKEATGVEIEMTNGVINKYDEMMAKIDSVIEKQKLEILMDARKEEYKKALISVYELEQKMQKAKVELDEAEIAMNKSHNSATAERYLKALESYNGIKKSHAEMHESIRIYEEGTILVQQGKTREAIELLQTKSGSIKKFEQLHNESEENKTRILKEQHEKAINDYIDYYQKLQNKQEGYTQDGLNKVKEYADECFKEYSKAGQKSNQGLADGLSQTKNKPQNQMNDTADQTYRTARNILSYSNFYNAGHDITRGVSAGIKGNQGGVLGIMGSFARNITNRFKNELGIHSPSRVFTALGEFTTIGLANGLVNPKEKIRKSMASLVDEVKNTNFTTTFNDGKIKHELNNNVNFNSKIEFENNLKDSNEKIINLLSSIVNDNNKIINIRIGEDTILTKVIEKIQEKQFETNGGICLA